MELLITLVVTGVLLVGTIDMLANLFEEHINYNNDIQSTQSKMISNERITSKIREGANIYSNGSSLTIPTQNSSVSVITGNRAIAALVPKFNSSGNLIQPSSSTTSFKGIAFSIITQSQWDGTSGNYVLIETDYDVDLPISAYDPLLVTGTLPNNWSNGQSYLIEKNLQPATLTTMGTQAFNVQGDIVNFAFVPTPTAIYFASTNGVASIDDRAYLNTVNFRNYKR